MINPFTVIYNCNCDFKFVKLAQVQYYVAQVIQV